MRTAAQWLEAYGESHRHPVNKILHWICVPMIVVSLVGLLWALPRPDVFREISPWFNWGTMLLAAALLYYLLLSPSLAVGMLLVVVAVGVLVNRLDRLPGPLWITCGTLFVLAWTGQFMGHRVEGKKPLFFEDVQFLLIGPLWLLGAIYRRLGVRY